MITRGQITASRTPGGNITFDTTHTSGGLIRSLGARPHIEIERADLDDAIAALRGLRGDRFEVGDRVRVVGGERHLGWIGQTGTITMDLRAVEGRESNPWNVRIDGVPPQAPHLGNGPVIAFATNDLQALQTPVQPGALVATGRWRVYFNKHGSADLPWCVAPDGGGWELAVADILISTMARTIYQPKATPDDEDGRPSAWIAVEGRLVVAGGSASITATREPEVQQP